MTSETAFKLARLRASGLSFSQISAVLEVKPEVARMKATRARRAGIPIRPLDEADPILSLLPDEVVMWLMKNTGSGQTLSMTIAGAIMDWWEKGEDRKVNRVVTLEIMRHAKAMDHTVGMAAIEFGFSEKQIEDASTKFGIKLRPKKEEERAKLRLSCSPAAIERAKEKLK